MLPVRTKDGPRWLEEEVFLFGLKYVYRRTGDVSVPEVSFNLSGGCSPHLGLIRFGP